MEAIYPKTGRTRMSLGSNVLTFENADARAYYVGWGVAIRYSVIGTDGRPVQQTFNTVIDSYVDASSMTMAATAPADGYWAEWNRTDSLTLVSNGDGTYLATSSRTYPIVIPMSWNPLIAETGTNRMARVLGAGGGSNTMTLRGSDLPSTISRWSLFGDVWQPVTTV